MKTLYDIHVHVMDLSHPNLSAFLLREDLIDKLIDDHVKAKTRFMAALASFFLSKKKLKKKVKSILDNGDNSLKKQVSNCLTFFEIPVEYQFLILDYFLKTGEESLFPDGRTLQMNGETYNKIVLCPLIMDFGYKNIVGSDFYNLVPTRPIAKQVGDLLYAIRTYYRFNLAVDDAAKKMRLSPEIDDYEIRKNEKLFEIYPFMGLDTRNYTLESLKGVGERPGLLAKYFANFLPDESADQRRNRLFAKAGKLDNNMHSREIDYTDIFAGIKVYPQLGFNPYPRVTDEMFAAEAKKDKAKAEAKAAAEMEKVRFLYRFCCDKRIPITTHCSDGGFKTGEYDYLTDPGGKWSEVLNDFPDLTLNFAHFGREKSQNTRWQQTIIELTAKYDNVYTDISCNDAGTAYYQNLNSIVTQAGETVKQKILFGSDFSINMLVTKVHSYNQYLKAFANAEIDSKTGMCSANAERFLFGGAISER